MARAGRKRKAGKREPNGRLKRLPEAQRIDRGTEWVQAMRHRFGEYYNTALGRAYASGLLGEGNEAKDRYDKARKFSALYSYIIGKDRYRCPLDTAPRGGEPQEYVPTEQDVQDQEWLIVNMTRMDLTGCRPFFDQLVSRQFTDCGPIWLDRLIDAKRKDRRDMIVMDAALKAIDAIKPVGGAKIILRNVA